jgi:hypothetical protein
LAIDTLLVVAPGVIGAVRSALFDIRGAATTTATTDTVLQVARGTTTTAAAVVTATPATASIAARTCGVTTCSTDTRATVVAPSGLAVTKELSTRSASHSALALITATAAAAAIDCNERKTWYPFSSASFTAVAVAGEVRTAPATRARGYNDSIT